MEEVVNKLSDLLQGQAELELIYKKKKEDFEAENIIIINGIKTHKEAIEQCKEDIRQLAEQEFKQTGNKKLYGGIGIRETSDMVYDESVALEWAKKHQMCLALDAKSFKSIAKAQPLDFVTIQNKITVTFPSEIKI